MKKNTIALLLALALLLGPAAGALAALGDEDVDDQEIDDTEEGQDEIDDEEVGVDEEESAAGSWYSEAVDILMAEGIIDEERDGPFEPNETLTIGQWLTFLVQAVNGDVEVQEEDSVAEAYSERAEELGLLDYSELVTAGNALSKATADQSETAQDEADADESGEDEADEDAPEEIVLTEEVLAEGISRYDMAATLVRAAETWLGESPAEESWAATGLTDYAKMTDEQQYNIDQAYAKGLVGGYPDGSFSGDATLTSAEAATVLLRLIDEDCRLDNDPVSIAFSGSITVEDTTIEMGMGEADVAELLGEPEDTLIALHSTTCWVYGAEDGQDFVTVGFTQGGMVYFVITIGTEFELDPSGSTDTAVYTDRYADNREYGAAIEVSLDFLRENDLLPEDEDEDAYEETMDDFAKLIFYVINAFRVDNDVAPLTWQDGLADAAVWKAEDMAYEVYFDHLTLDGATPSEVASWFGVYKEVGQVLSYNETSPMSTALRWLSSKSARATLLDEDITKAGVGRAYSEEDPDNHYTCMLYY